MAELGISFDDSSFLEHAGFLKLKLKAAERKALGVVGDELLRLSQLEVPFRTGELMNSGVSQSDGDDWIVGYNKVYAARLHEHPEYRFNNGRKGKYLEDPMKINREIFTEFFGATMRTELGVL